MTITDKVGNLFSLFLCSSVEVDHLLSKLCLYYNNNKSLVLFCVFCSLNVSSVLFQKNREAFPFTFLGMFHALVSKVVRFSTCFSSLTGLKFQLKSNQ